MFRDPDSMERKTTLIDACDDNLDDYAAFPELESLLVASQFDLGTAFNDLEGAIAIVREAGHSVYISHEYIALVYGKLQTVEYIIQGISFDDRLDVPDRLRHPLQG